MFNKNSNILSEQTERWIRYHNITFINQINTFLISKVTIVFKWGFYTCVNIIVNTALTRRRIRTGKLRNIILKVGDQSKTDVVLMYIEDIADQSMVDEVKHRIEQVKVDGLTMTDKELEEFITGQVYNPYPLVRYTERPDVVAAHLYQGMIAIIVDTSPSVMIGPVTLFDHLTSVEEYRQTPAVGTFLRLIRYAGIIVSVFLMPTWLLFVLHPEYLPDFLNFIGPQEEGNIPIVLQTPLVFPQEFQLMILQSLQFHLLWQRFLMVLLLFLL